MEYVRIEILSKYHPSVLQIKNVVLQEAPISWITLFEGDRWPVVEYAAVAFNKSDGSPVGLATLAPTNELRSGGPEIIGVWVHPYVRKCGVGLQLIRALAEKSMEVYGVAPAVMACSQQGYGLVVAAQREQVAVVARFVAGTQAFELP